MTEAAMFAAVLATGAAFLWAGFRGTRGAKR
jgi:hypothetical protein